MAILRKLFITMASAMIALPALYSCGGAENGGTNVTSVSDGEQEYVPDPHDDDLSVQQLDSMAVASVDYLTPGQAARVLTYYSELIDKGSSKARWETMRKFKDVYNIVLSNNRSTFHSALKSNKRTTGVDLEALYEQYDGKLTSYDEGSGVAPSENSGVDSVKITIDSTTTVVATPVD